MRKTLLYILTSAALLTACHENELDSATSSYLNGTEKTPLLATALLGVESTPQTRAANKTFDNGDQLVAYIRQVKWNGTTDGARTLVSAQKSPSLITFTKGGAAMTAYTGSDITPIGTGKALGLTPGESGNTNVASDLTVTGGLYWDDFSVNDPSTDGTETSTYLRDANHYLQSYYGYCYNGGTPSTNLTEASGELGWTVQADQTATGAFQHSDLLWSAEQNPIAYIHATFNGGSEHGQLILPFTHAMSKVTINLTARNGFSDDFKFTATEVSLNNKNTVCTTTAPTLTLVASTVESAVKDIKMLGGSDATVKQRSYSAIMVPSALKEGELFATITGADGNKYEIKVTPAMLQKGIEHEGKGWGEKLTSNATQSGVHYVLDVTIDKQAISVSALLKDWDDVTAVGDGEIKFDNDITTKGSIDVDFLKDNKFDVYKDETNASTSFTTKSTTLTWSDSQWSYDPIIYWNGQGDASYFRALSPAATTTAMSEGSDILWGYACDNDDDKTKVGTSDEVKITPRTGDVPLHFEHPMSKISVILKNDKDASGATIPEAARVALAGAKISIINLYDLGTLNLSDGTIGNLSVSDDAPFTIKDQTVNSEFKWLDNIVIPQSLIKNKNNEPRESVPTFYDLSELTKIYASGKSVPDGSSGEYYLTSKLDIVKYDSNDLTEIYANGTSINDGSAPETYVTSTLDQVAEIPAVMYDEEEANTLNTANLIDDSEGRRPKDDGYVKTYKPGYEEVTTSTVKSPAVPAHYKVNENSKKATTETINYYRTNSDSEKHAPGDLKDKGDMIMLYITLTDGTRYKVDLSQCKATASDGSITEEYVTEWERGKHYTYTISLQKEQITFRAMVKEWIEKTGSGNATLDWD